MAKVHHFVYFEEDSPKESESSSSSPSPSDSSTTTGGVRRRSRSVEGTAYSSVKKRSKRNKKLRKMRRRKHRKHVKDLSHSSGPVTPDDDGGEGGARRRRRRHPRKDTPKRAASSGMVGRCAKSDARLGDGPAFPNRTLVSLRAPLRRSQGLLRVNDYFVHNEHDDDGDDDARVHQSHDGKTPKYPNESPITENAPQSSSHDSIANVASVASKDIRSITQLASSDEALLGYTSDGMLDGAALSPISSDELSFASSTITIRGRPNPTINDDHVEEEEEEDDDGLSTKCDNSANSGGGGRLLRSFSKRKWDKKAKRNGQKPRTMDMADLIRTAKDRNSSQRTLKKKSTQRKSSLTDEHARTKGTSNHHPSHIDEDEVDGDRSVRDSKAVVVLLDDGQIGDQSNAAAATTVPYQAPKQLVLPVDGEKNSTRFSVGALSLSPEAVESYKARARARYLNDDKNKGLSHDDGDDDDNDDGATAKVGRSRGSSTEGKDASKKPLLLRLGRRTTKSSATTSRNAKQGESAGSLVEGDSPGANVVPDSLRIVHGSLDLEAYPMKERILGKGADGQVVRAAYFGVPVCVKQFYQAYMASLEDADVNFWRELAVHRELGGHPNIVRLLGADAHKRVLMMEYVDGGTLRTLYTRSPTLLSTKCLDGRRRVQRILYGVASAMAYMHAQTPAVIHRDLKSSNILLTSLPDCSPRLCDFGASREFLTHNVALTMRVGTIRWTAPELLRQPEKTKDETTAAEMAKKAKQAKRADQVKRAVDASSLWGVTRVDETEQDKVCEQSPGVDGGMNDSPMMDDDADQRTSSSIKARSSSSSSSTSTIPCQKTRSSSSSSSSTTTTTTTTSMELGDGEVSVGEGAAIAQGDNLRAQSPVLGRANKTPTTRKRSGSAALPVITASEMSRSGQNQSGPTYDFKVDVYSFGLVMWEVLACALPWEQYRFDYEIEDAVLRGERPPIEAEWDVILSAMMRKCWQQEANARPTFCEILKMLKEWPTEFVI